MAFFQPTFGFDEVSYGDTQRLLLSASEFEAVDSVLGVPLGFHAERCWIRNKTSGAKWSAGVASTPSVAELRALVSALVADPTVAAVLAKWHASAAATEGKPLIQLKNITGESRSLHSQPDSFRAVVQAASQFNLLEFAGPGVTPERGISGYIHDHTQGPACATACAAGTAYRNYLMPTPFNDLGTGRGQTAENQINCLADVEALVSKAAGGHKEFWRTKNGYVDSGPRSLQVLNQLLAEDDGLHEQIISALRIGVQEDTEVTDSAAGTQNVRCEDAAGKVRWVKRKLDRFAEVPFVVTQTYNAAISVGYSQCASSDWKPLAQLVLHGSYEATLLVAVVETLRLLVEGGGSADVQLPNVYLTKVGGGVFANGASWINAAIARAMRRVAEFRVPLRLKLVHFATIDRSFDNLASLDAEKA